MAFNKCCLYTKVQQKVKYKKLPWITFGILKSVRHKSKLYSRFIQSLTSICNIKYTKYKNILTTAINLSKKIYFRNLIEDHRGNSTGLWKFINKILHEKHNIDLNKIFVCGNGLIRMRTKLQIVLMSSFLLLQQIWLINFLRASFHL